MKLKLKKKKKKEVSAGVAKKCEVPVCFAPPGSFLTSQIGASN